MDHQGEFTVHQLSPWSFFAAFRPVDAGASYNAAPMITPEHFRDVLRHFASGVTLVTARRGEQIHGLTVSAFTSVSAEPPLIAVVIDQRSALHGLLADPEAVFAVNILGHDQREMSDRFAFVPDADRFAVGDWGRAENGAPILRDALAWLACTVQGRQEVGSHILYVGRVLESAVPRADEAPLVYWNRGYHRLAD
jgi:flavin reductase (DIM6/NTAB) family NADH-FMN oxidoreductase RutF